MNLQRVQVGRDVVTRRAVGSALTGEVRVVRREPALRPVKRRSRPPFLGYSPAAGHFAHAGGEAPHDSSGRRPARPTVRGAR